MDVPNHIMARFRRMMNLEAPEAGSTPAIPEFVGHYRIGRVLGTGASAVVCEGEDLTLKRRVALKILRPEGGSATFLARFHREASLAANLKHPNLITIHEVAMVRQPDGTPLHYIVMDCVPRTLREWSEETGKPDPRTAARLVGTVARAIHHAHERGIIHRDLKPANILIDEAGRPIVTDFGLAKEISDDAGMTKSGVAVGTPLYMSPEQVRGDSGRVGAATDIYSLGAILYELLTGRPPFTAENIAEIYTKVLRDPPSDARSLDRAIPPELSAICRKALEKDPPARYASAEALAQDIDRFLAGQSVLAMKTHLISQVGRALRRNPGRIATVVLLVAVAATVVAWKVTSDREAAWQALLGRASDSLSTHYLRMRASSAEFAETRERTRKLIDECLAARPGELAPRLLKIRFLMHGTKYTAAEDEIREAKRINPNEPHLLYYDAIARLLNLVDARAEVENRRAASGIPFGLEPIDPPPAGVTAEFEGIVAVLRASPVIQPYETALVEGLIRVAEGRHADAIAPLGVYIASMAFDATALQVRGHAYLRTGDGGAAATDLTQALALFPVPTLHWMLSQARIQTGDYAGALAEIDRTGWTKNPAWHIQRSTTLLRLSRAADAVGNLDQAIALDPKNGYWHVKRSFALRKTGQPEKALEDCAEALRLGASVPLVLSERYKVHLDLQHADLAQQDLDRILAEGRGRPLADALTQVARMKLDPAGSDAALGAIIELCDRAQVEDPGYAPIYSLRACARYNILQRDAGSAAEAWRKVLDDGRRYLQLLPGGDDRESVERFIRAASTRLGQEEH